MTLYLLLKVLFSTTWSFIITKYDLAVYRVNWLRAKARRDRWSEEKVLLESEIQWTHLFFVRQADTWLKRSHEAPPHLQHYALTQRHMWLQFSSYSQRALDSLAEASPTDLL